MLRINVTPYVKATCPVHVRVSWAFADAGANDTDWMDSTGHHPRHKIHNLGERERRWESIRYTMASVRSSVDEWEYTKNWMT